MRPACAPASGWIAAFAAYLAAGVVMLWVIRPPASQIYWPPIESLPQAIGEVVSAAVYQYPLAHAVAVLLAIGAYSVIRRPSRNRWIVLGMAAVGSVLYCVVAGSSSETLRLWLTGPWYNNPPRLASVWAVAVLPLAALGATSLVRFVARRIFRAPALRRAASRQPLAVLAVFGLVLAVLSQGEAMRQAAADIEYTHQLREGGPILTPDELRLMVEVRDLVPEGDVIAANPWTGASFAYGVGGRRVLMPHLLMDETPAAHVINTKFDTAGDSPAVCDALEETGVRYILDFDGGDFQENSGDYTGIDELEDSPWVDLVASEGGARLYKITSCGFGS